MRASPQHQGGKGWPRRLTAAAVSKPPPVRPALPPSMRDRVPFLLYRASQISHTLANQMLADIALSARQAGILTMVTELEPMTQKALGTPSRSTGPPW